MVRRQSLELDPGSHLLAPAINAFNRGNGWYRAVLIGKTIVASLTPLIESIRSARKVGLAGMWHGVSDLIARTFIGPASTLGSVETGVAAAEAILIRAPAVIRITPRWHVDRATGTWFSLRRVCCLAYTGTSALYCDTCPLLDEEEIANRLASNQAGAL